MGAVTAPDYRNESLAGAYVPSIEAWNFHRHMARFRFLIWGIKSGKCLSILQAVLLANGETKKAGDLVVGDRLMGYETGTSEPVEVIALEPEFNKESAEIEFVDGSIVWCSVDHRFPVWNYKLQRVQVKQLNEIVNKDGIQHEEYYFIKPKLCLFDLKNSTNDHTHIGTRRVTWIGKKPCIHISVSGKSQCFLLDNFVATHNTAAGAQETARAAIALPGARIWVVAPTYAHLDEAERELLKVLWQLPGLVVGRHRSKHEIYLSHGGLIQCKSGEIPDNLRGPNVHFAWFDEAGFGKKDANYILRERVAATKGEIIYTTTPRGRNWMWTEVQLAGMLSNQSYGEFECASNDGGLFVSHFPTWHFPWVEDGDIEALRRRMSKQIFDQEVGAMFMSDAARAFPLIEPFMTTAKPNLSPTVQLVMGLDLAKFQDWTAAVIMDGTGRAIHMDRWNEVSWNIQKPRIVRMAKQWKAALVMDRANVGSVIYDDLLAMGLNVHAVDMNSPFVKNSLIEELIIAFENGEITIPDPRADWAPKCAEQMCSELDWYERGKTSGNRITYSAPKGLTDDMVVALALANRGRSRGMADSLDAAGVAVGSEDYNSLLDEEQEAMNNGGNDRDLMQLPSMRPQTFSSIFNGRRSSVGFSTFDRGVWR